MFREDYEAAMHAAGAKSGYLKNQPAGYFLASVLAGVFVGFGVLLIFTIGGLLEGAAYTRVLMGASFGVALSLVVMAGSELFTGNNFIMTAGILGKTVTPGEAARLWIVCYLGNWTGSVLLAAAFHFAGLSTGAVGGFIAQSAAAKMAVPFVPLLLRGVLCNMLVCLAVWCGIRCKTESGKLIMVFWCLFAFITTGYEHSIANMTLLTVSLFAPFGEAVSLGGYFYNLLVVTLGNLVGGILCLAIPYHIISSKKG